MVTTATRSEVEWVGEPPTPEGTGWPDLRPSPSSACDGANPSTGRVCILGHHSGYHRDSAGAEWLDEE